MWCWGHSMGRLWEGGEVPALGGFHPSAEAEEQIEIATGIASAIQSFC